MRKPGVFLLMFALSACGTLVQKGGELLEGGSEKVLAVYRSDAKERKAELKLLRLPDGEAVEISGAFSGLAVRGNAPEPDGTFAITGIHLLSSHAFGWNELVLDVTGSAVLLTEGSSVTLRITEIPERVQLSSGKIRLKNSRLSGEEALTHLQNRRERILVLVEWMAASNPPVFADWAAFRAYWRYLLFPELTAAKKRPPAYSKNAKYVRVGGIAWNTDYTKTLFPEELWILRDSGALLRDWEEAFAWIYLEYSWNTSITFFDGARLTQKK